MRPTFYIPSRDQELDQRNMSYCHLGKKGLVSQELEIGSTE